MKEGWRCKYWRDGLKRDGGERLLYERGLEAKENRAWINQEKQSQFLGKDA